MERRSRAWNVAAELGTSRVSRASGCFSRVGMFLARRDALGGPQSLPRARGRWREAPDEVPSKSTIPTSRVKNALSPCSRPVRSGIYKRKGSANSQNVRIRRSFILVYPQCRRAGTSRRPYGNDGGAVRISMETPESDPAPPGSFVGYTSEAMTPLPVPDCGQPGTTSPDGGGKGVPLPPGGASPRRPDTPSCAPQGGQAARSK